MQTISERLSYFIDNQGVNIYEFEQKVGISNGTIGRIIKEHKSFRADLLEKILNHYPSLNTNWLLKGAGSMIISHLPSINKKDLIPFFSDLAFAGLLDNGEGSAIPESYLHIPGFEYADAAITVYGNSMVPYYTSGDIIVVRELKGGMGEWPWGKVGLLVTRSGRYLKYLHRHPDGHHLLLLSANPETPPMVVGMAEILRAFAIMGKVVKHEL